MPTNHAKSMATDSITVGNRSKAWAMQTKHEQTQGFSHLPHAFGLA